MSMAMANCYGKKRRCLSTVAGPPTTGLNIKSGNGTTLNSELVELNSSIEITINYSLIAVLQSTCDALTSTDH